MPEEEADPFALDDEDTDENQVEDGDANKNFTELRKAYKRSERQLKATEKELEDLRVFKQTVVAETRKGQIESTFKEVGLSPKHALLFEKVNPEAEVSAEVVQAFAAEYDLPTQAGEQVEAPTPQPQGFNPVTTGTTPAAGMLTHDDIMELVKAGDMGAVEKAYAQGRVIREPVPWVVP